MLCFYFPDSFDSEASDISLENEDPDLDRVSFNVKDTLSNTSLPQQDPNSLGVEPMIRAPSIEDIMGGLGTESEGTDVESEGVDDFLGSRKSKEEFQRANEEKKAATANAENLGESGSERAESSSDIAAGDQELGEKRSATGDKVIQGDLMEERVLPKLEITDRQFSMDEDEPTSATPTNLLDEPEFQTTIPPNLVSAAIRHIEQIREKSESPEYIPRGKSPEKVSTPSKEKFRNKSPEKMLTKLEEKMLSKSENDVQVLTKEGMKITEPQRENMAQMADALKEPSPKSETESEAEILERSFNDRDTYSDTDNDVSDLQDVDLREIPIAVTRVIGDQLDLPWVYYFLLATSSAMFALAMDMPVPLFILLVSFISFISFRILDNVQ